MTEFLPTLATLTLGGAVAILIFAFAAKASRNRYGARWRCWIWALLCLRLILPFSFLPDLNESTQAPIQLETPSDTVIFEYDSPRQPAAPPVGTTENVPPSSTPTLPDLPAVIPSESPQSGLPEEVPAVDEPAEKTISVTLSEVLFLVWAAGVLVMMVWVLVSHLRFVRYVRRWSRPVEDPAVIRMYNQLGDGLKLDRRPNLRICEGLKAPMLAGLFSPRLLLPETLPMGDELRYTLVHELTHFRRRDIWLKSLALLANIIHWFNPCMWYMVRLVERDTELACDEAALRQLPAEDHAAYGRTILNAVERLKLK